MIIWEKGREGDGILPDLLFMRKGLEVDVYNIILL